MRRLTPQKPGAQSVERRYPHLAAVDAEQRLDTRAHLFGRLVREGDREKAVGGGDAAADDMRDAMRDDAGLARAGTREDQQRPLRL